MTAQYPITQDLLAEQAEEAARLAQIQQIASASQVTGPQSPPNAAPLPRIDLDTGYIAFHGGVPVGGFSHLTVYADGSYAYTGHFHVSGAPSYNYGLVWVLKDSQGRPFSFSHGGRLHGTFESGSRDDDWAFTGTNQQLARFWPDLAAGYSWAWKSAVNIDIRALINSTVEAVGTAISVIAIVA